MDYDKLHYYVFQFTAAAAIEELRHGVKYAIVYRNDDTPVAHLVFEESQTGFVTAEEEYYIPTPPKTVVNTYIEWWEKHPDSFPQWETKEVAIG